MLCKIFNLICMPGLQPKYKGTTATDLFLDETFVRHAKFYSTTSTAPQKGKLLCPKQINFGKMQFVSLKKSERASKDHPHTLIIQTFVKTTKSIYRATSSSWFHLTRRNFVKGSQMLQGHLFLAPPSVKVTSQDLHLLGPSSRANALRFNISSNTEVSKISSVFG